MRSFGRPKFRGAVLRKARILAGLSPMGLSRRSGVSRQTIERLEQNPNVGVHLRTAKTLADTLGMDIEELLIIDVEEGAAA